MTASAPPLKYAAAISTPARSAGETSRIAAVMCEAARNAAIAIRERIRIVLVVSHNPERHVIRRLVSRHALAEIRLLMRAAGGDVGTVPRCERTPDSALRIFGHPLGFQELIAKCALHFAIDHAETLGYELLVDEGGIGAAVDRCVDDAGAIGDRLSRRKLEHHPAALGVLLEERHRLVAEAFEDRAG